MSQFHREFQSSFFRRKKRQKNKYTVFIVY